MTLSRTSTATVRNRIQGSFKPFRMLAVEEPASSDESTFAMFMGHFAKVSQTERMNPTSANRGQMWGTKGADVAPREAFSRRARPRR